MMRAGFSGLVAERRHVGGDAAQRPHEQLMQRDIDQRRGDAGDQQRQQQDVPGEAQHRLAQRLLVEHDLDELAAHRRRADHAHDVGVVAEQRVEGVDDGAVPAHVAHVDVVVDGRAASRSTASRRRCWPIFMATARAPIAVEDLARHRLRHHAARRRLEHQRGGVGGGQPVVEPVQPEIGDRGHIDQHFRDHHEQDREDEELARQSQARHARAGRSFRRRGSIRHSDAFCSRSPSVASFRARRKARARNPNPCVVMIPGSLATLAPE